MLNAVIFLNICCVLKCKKDVNPSNYSYIYIKKILCYINNFFFKCLPILISQYRFIVLLINNFCLAQIFPFTLYANKCNSIGQPSGKITEHYRVCTL